MLRIPSLLQAAAAAPSSFAAAATAGAPQVFWSTSIRSSCRESSLSHPFCCRPKNKYHMRVPEESTWRLNATEVLLSLPCLSGAIDEFALLARSRSGNPPPANPTATNPFA